MRVRSCVAECGPSASLRMRHVLFADLFEALGEGADDGGEGAAEGDEAGGGYGSGAHGADVGAPEVGGATCR